MDIKEVKPGQIYEPKYPKWIEKKVLNEDGDYVTTEEEPSKIISITDIKIIKSAIDQNNKKGFLTEVTGCDGTKRKMFFVNYIFTNYMLTLKTDVIESTVAKQTSNMYSDKTRCPNCGAPAYQPLIRPIECSKNCQGK